MSSLFSPGGSAALSILCSLLYFVLIMVLTILFIERIWVGRSQWTIVPLVLFSFVLFGFHPALFLDILEAVTGFFSFRGMVVISGFGILAGMATSSL